MNVSIHSQYHSNWLELHKNSFKKSYPEVYKKYDINIDDLVNEVEDEKNNIFIAPEIFPDMFSTFKNIQKAVWWLSVDNGVGQDQRNFIIERNNLIKEHLVSEKKYRILLEMIQQYQIHDCSHKNIMIEGICHFQYSDDKILDIS
jgi:hypothetical protein